MTIINKFGGEIIGDPHLVQLAVKWIKTQLKRNQKPVVVVSALNGVTDQLMRLSQSGEEKILNNLDKKHKDWMKKMGIKEIQLERKIENLWQELKKDLKKIKKAKEKLALRDKILSYGEKISSILFKELLKKEGVLAKEFSGDELGIITDQNFGNANLILPESLKNIKSKLKNISEIPVIGGFVGKTKDGQITILGRGGSDTTACLIGLAFNPSRVILWKNVPGVLSADPKIVENPKAVKFLSYGEAEEAGKVICAKAIDLVREKRIKVEVTYIVAPEQKTIIENNVPKRDGAKIISSRAHLYLLIVRGEKMARPGAIFEITKVISQEGINIVLIRDTKSKVYLVVEKNRYDFEDLKRKISDLDYRLSIKEVSMVNAVGKMDWKIAERFNQLLYEFCSEAELGAFPYRNCLRLDTIVGKSKVKKLIKIFHKEFICK